MDLEGRQLLKKHPKDLKKGDVLLLEDGVAVSKAKIQRWKDHVSIIVVKGKISKVLKEHVTCIPYEDLDVQEIDRYASVDKDAFQKAAKKAQRDWTRIIETMIKDYRKSRIQ